MQGGYANMGLNYVNQSYVTGNWGLEGKSITSLLMAGSLRYNSSISGQMAIGAADPWFSVHYSSLGLYSTGVHTDRNMGVTMGRSAIGIFTPLYLRSPLLNSGAGDYIIGNGLMAPAQKALD
jgi:hypothetical protein